MGFEYDLALGAVPLARVAFEGAIVFFLGLVLGSFATALAWRVPRGESWIVQRGAPVRSACPHCGGVLGVRDLVPVLSFLCLRGRCRRCHTPISARYPLIEGVSVLACLAAWGGLGFSPQLFVVLAAVPFLIALVVIDLERMLLPNQLVAIVGGLGLVFVGLKAFRENAWDILLWHGLAGIVYGGFVWGVAWVMGKILRKDALGMGDVKFFIVAGVWLGLEAFPLFLLLSGLIGLIFGGVWRFVSKNVFFPFGPAIILAFYGILISPALNQIWLRMSL